MARYRFALRPWWIVSHVFVLAMVLGMLRLGIWQLDRLDQRRQQNAVVAERENEPVADVEALGDPDAYESFDSAEQLEFRRAQATGTYLADDEVIVRSRSFDGSPGSWVLTPLELDDGSIVIVNRGWIPNPGQLDAVPDEYRAPTGQVTVVGMVRMSEQRGSIGATDPSDGHLTDLARADIGRLDAQIDGDVLPLYLQLIEQDPAPGDVAPLPVPLPELDEGPHLNYAIQWVLFSTMTVVVYGLILRKKAGDIEREERLG